MTVDSEQLDLATRLGAWLATYWVHAAAAIAATWVLARTVLKHAPASTRAFAWRAALVAPLLTSVAKSEWIAEGPQLEVDWLGRTTVPTRTESPGTALVDTGREPRTRLAPRTERDVRTDSIDSGSIGSGSNASVPGADARTSGDARPSGSRTSPAHDAEHDVAASGLVGAPRTDAAPLGRRTDALAPALGAVRDPALSRGTLSAGTLSDGDSSIGDSSIGAASTRTPATRAAADAHPLLAVDPRRLALLVAAAAALLALARWLDGWLRLGRTLGPRRPLAAELAERAAHLARSMNVPRARVTSSDTARVPMAFGFLRPQVCLPTGFERGLSTSEWDAAVAHELAHVVRGDTRWLPGMRLVARLFAFQPLNRLAWRELERESEHAADEVAVGTTGSSHSLALCLAKVATRATGDRRVLPAAAVTGAPTMAARASLVVERTERLLRGRLPRRSGPLVRLGALFPTLFVAFAAPRLTPALVRDSGLDSGLDAGERAGTSFAVEPLADGMLADGRFAEGRLAELDRSLGRTIDAVRSEAALATNEVADPSRRELFDDLADALGFELSQARLEIEQARPTLNPEFHPRLDEMVTTLDRLDASFELVLELIELRLVDDASTNDHGAAARANAADTEAPSPTFEPARD